MPVDYAALKDEIQTDPLTLGYAPNVTAGNHVAIADALNLVRDTIFVKQGIIPTHQLFEAITTADFTALTNAGERRLAMILTMVQVNTAGDNTRAHLLQLFPGATPTHANLIALFDRKGSRAEQLFGAGANITPADVALALAS